jgi:ADP-ribose pyrophosphatase
MNKPIVPRQIRKAFQGRIFTVNVESITLPRGEQLDVEIVRHPGSAVLIPVTADGAVVLVRQYRHAIGRFAWELPAGSLKPGEDPGAAAARECQEEVGLIPAAMEHLGGFFPTPGYCDEEMHVYLATGLREPTDSDPPVRQDEDEDIDTKAFSIDEISDMIATGAIVDLKTVAGLTLLQRRLGSRDAG